MSGQNTLTLERAMLARQVQRGGPGISYAEHLLTAPPCPGCDEPEPACICGGVEDDFDIASARGFSEPLDGEQHGANLSLYAIHVFDCRTDELLGKYPADSGDLGRDRALAVEAATTDAERTWDWCRGDLEGAGPPDGSQVYCQEEWR